MLMVWRGFGWAVPVIIFAALLGTQIALNRMFGEGYYQAHDWAKSLAFISASIGIGVLGYFLNYKTRVVFLDEASGKNKKSPSHTLFFIPIEFWAIIVPIVFLSLGYVSKQKDIEERLFLTEPKVNDIYSVELPKIYTNVNEAYKYGLIKVTSVDTDGVEVIASKMAYNKKSGIRKDISSSEYSKPDYFSSDTDFLESELLLELHETGGIYSVVRN